LKLAGLTRAELFPPPEDNPDIAATWAHLTFHDLKGTGVTWMAQRGDNPVVIQQRAAHRQFSTTQRYLREAETLGTDGVAPFPPLPPDLLDAAGGAVPGGCPPAGDKTPKAPENPGPSLSGTRGSKTLLGAFQAAISTLGQHDDPSKAPEDGTKPDRGTTLGDKEFAAASPPASPLRGALELALIEATRASSPDLARALLEQLLSLAAATAPGAAPSSREVAS
jgi:hypothetical protein